MTSPQPRTLVTLLTLLIVVLCGLYSNHFHNEFHFDDGHTTTSNPYIRDLNNIPRFFRDRTTFSTMPSHQGYRPLVSTTLALDYWVGGKSFDPFYFHVSNFSWFLVI